MLWTNMEADRVEIHVFKFNISVPFCSLPATPQEQTISHFPINNTTIIITHYHQKVSANLANVCASFVRMDAVQFHSVSWQTSHHNRSSFAIVSCSEWSASCTMTESDTLQDSQLAEHACSSTYFLHQKTSGYITLELYPPKTAWSFKNRQLQDLELYAGVHVQQTSTRLGKLTTVDKVTDQHRKQLWACVKAKERHFEHMWCCILLNRHF